MLHNDDKIASKAVEEKPFAIRPGKIPTDEEMQQLKDHIKKMKVCYVIFVFISYKINQYNCFILINFVFWCLTPIF